MQAGGIRHQPHPVTGFQIEFADIAACQHSEFAGIDIEKSIAAEVLGKTRTDFMLEASERRAEEVLLDRTLFTVSPEIYVEYLARLDAPAKPNERLKRTMSSKAPWEEV